MTVIVESQLEIWAPFQYKDCLSQVLGIPMLKIRRSRDRLIFNMGSYTGKTTSLYWDGPQVPMDKSTGLYQYKDAVVPV